MSKIILVLLLLIVTNYCANFKLTATQKQAILDAHNKIRNSTAAGGSNQLTGADISVVKWWTELENKAQKYANNFPMQHNPNTTVNGSKQTGENMYWSWNSVNVSYKGNEAVNSWAAEVQNLNKNNINSFYSVQDTGVTGHYTQIVWAKTQYIGCGIAYNTDQNMYKTTVVCNYYPPGNWVGQKIYQTGTPGSKCSKKDIKYKNLCQLSANVPSAKTVNLPGFNNILQKLLIEEEQKQLKNKKKAAHKKTP